MLNKYEINGVLIKKIKNDLFILLNENSDLISLYVILKFYCIKDILITNMFLMLSDEKNINHYQRENIYEIQDLNLNEFLLYYKDKLVLNEKTSGYDENSDFRSIIGWRLILKESKNQINPKDIKYIEEKILEYRENKFKKKNIIL